VRGEEGGERRERGKEKMRELNLFLILKLIIILTSNS
jgi:hypothetical protein